MTIYENRFSKYGVMLLAHCSNDFELVIYEATNLDRAVTHSFKTISDAIYFLHGKYLKTDLSCSSCKRKIDRQVARAQEKYQALNTEKK